MTTNGPPPGGQTFGTHAINCTYHPYGEYSLKDIEDKMSAEVNDFKGYNQHLDSHLGIWAPELSTYISKLGETPYHKMSFKHEESTYYSIITQACAGYYVELITDNAPEDKDSYTLVDEPRLDFTDFTRPSKQEVVKVSRATTLLDEMVHFYT